MSITYNRMTDANVELAFRGPTWCFPAIASDTNYLVDPYTGASEEEVPLVAGAISVDIDTEAIKVEFWNKRVVTIAAGILTPQVLYPLHIVKLWDTGTGASINVNIWQGELCRLIRFQPFYNLPRS